METRSRPCFPTITLIMSMISCSSAASAACPRQYALVCPESRGGFARYACVLQRLRVARNTNTPDRYNVSSICEAYARSIVTAHTVRESLKTAPLNRPKQCGGVGQSPGGQAPNWDAWSLRTHGSSSWRIPQEESATSIDFTLISQMSSNRFWMMRHICARWHGDIVVAVLLKRSEEAPKLPVSCRVPSETHKKARAAARLNPSLSSKETAVSRPSSDPKVRTFDYDPAAPRRVQVLFMREEDLLDKENNNASLGVAPFPVCGLPPLFPCLMFLVPQVMPCDTTQPTYQVNRLRNLALCHVKTSHAFYTDIDLFPSNTLYRRLHLTKVG